LDGQFVLETEARVSVFDRCFRYGDGLFETLRVYGGTPFAYEQHLDRLQHGCEFLRIRLPYDFGELKTLALELIRRNQMPEAVLRLQLSRGTGQRGYAPTGNESPLLVMTLDDTPAIENTSPARWRLITGSLRLPMHDPLAAFKTCSKLAHVLASAEARERNAQDALLLNTDGDVVETTGANLFWIKDRVVCTPPLTCGALPGVTRALVINLCSKLGLDLCEHKTSLDDLLRADAVFLTQSVREIVEVTHLDDIAVRQSPLVKALSQAYHELRVQAVG
jgi:aminodeoxychorismate lyase